MKPSARSANQHPDRTGHPRNIHKKPVGNIIQLMKMKFHGLSTIQKILLLLLVVTSLGLVVIFLYGARAKKQVESSQITIVRPTEQQPSKIDLRQAALEDNSFSNLFVKTKEKLPSKTADKQLNKQNKEEMQERKQIDYIGEAQDAIITRAFLSSKIMLANQNERDKILDMLFKAREMRGIAEPYIDFVLKHPTLKFIVVNNIINNVESNTIMAGYVPAENTIKLTRPLMRADINKQVQTICHELWHAYQALLNTHFKSPDMIRSPERLNVIANPYVIEPKNPFSMKRFLEVIKLGKNRIQAIHGAFARANTHEIHNYRRLYTDKLKDYQAKVFFVHMPEKEMLPFMSTLDTNVKLGHLSELQVKNDKTGFHWNYYVKSYSKHRNGYLILRCYSLQDFTNPLKAFVSDVMLTHLGIEKPEEKIFREYTELSEIDASLQEFSRKHVDLFYPERREYHNQRFQQMLLKASTLPYKSEQIKPNVIQFGGDEGYIEDLVLHL